MKSSLFFLVLLSGLLKAQSSPCTSNLGGGSDPGFVEIRIESTPFKHVTNAPLSTYYHEYAPTAETTASLNSGNTYNLYTFTSSEAITAIWLDYNHNGVFEAEEYTLLTNSMITQNTSTLSIPQSVPAGKIKARVRSRAFGSPLLPADACKNFGSGETRDYTLQIVNNALSVSEADRKKHFKSYPNPVTDEFTFESDAPIDFINLHDASGREILRKSIGNTRGQVDLSHLSKGNYILNVHSKKQIQSSSIIKN
ncbi:hypothetical protein B0A69_13845 [Chryseobacterium shigense]|uniref:Por secretion system C-terminal sorting domain-containing protein n=1 Tax=Chryseobacterium shigense TaxID=297244 RepID=A0A1N7HUU5_9FLAO|nr:GEVED domain-containing protein [Chryseobacterium shigense]PQA93223.1 hypothetical protein B0A69_13845 [Chryseobacterium shigense]SIS28634.1 Por secretion system C-terminal sorting domain-containing protein [Chryseobacterium shigense]